MLELIPAIALLGIFAERTENSVIVDGVLNEQCWHDPQVSCEYFTSFRPVCDTLMTLPTSVSIVYDDDSISFGCFMHDPDPSRINHQVCARDEDAPVDKIYIYLDTFDDDANCFVFTVSVDGTQLDSRRTEIYGDDSNWDAVWSSSVSECDSGWTAEIDIPFSALRYSSEEVQSWGINIGRVISHSNEAGYLYRMKEQGDTDVSCFGELSGLSGLPSNRTIEFRPFAAGRLQMSSGEHADPWGSAGADMKMSLNMQTVLDLSVFPDFGQVESDADQSSTSHWDPWLNEKRPFFMEGAEVFDMPFNMFYSRNIGSVASNGELIQILGGAKITGTSGGTRYGFLEVMTDEVWDEDTLLLEPASSWLAGSALHEFSGGNWLKLSGTSVDSFSGEAFRGDYSRSASLRGMKTFLEDFQFQGCLGVTWNREEDVSDNSAVRMDAGYFPEGFELNFRYVRRGEDFNQGTMGYYTGSGSEMWSAYSSVSCEANSSVIDQLWFDVNPYYSLDLSGRNAGSGVTVSGGGVTVDRYDLNVWVDYMDRWFDRYEGPEGRWYPSGFSGGISSSTDYRRALAGWISVDRNAYLDSETGSYSLGLRIKPVPELFITVEPSLDIQEPATKYNWDAGLWERTDSDWRTLQVSATIFLTGEMRLRLNGQTSRFNRNWETGSSSFEEHNTWANLLYSWEYSPGSWFHFLAGEEQEGESDPVFTVYAKLARYF